MEREYPPAPIAAVGVVVVQGDRVLLVRRGQEPGRGRWSLPGGAIELGETVAQAAEREVREECSIEVEIRDVIEVIDRIIPDDGRIRYHYILIDLLAAYCRGEPTASSDAAEVRWVSEKELDELELSQVTRRVIRKGLQMAATEFQRQPPIYLWQNWGPD